MAFTEVDISKILERATGYPVPPQYGPLRRYDREMRCMSGTKQRRCGSPTNYKVKGVPLCSTHALHELNYQICVLTGEHKDDNDYEKWNPIDTQCATTEPNLTLP